MISRSLDIAEKSRWICIIWGMKESVRAEIHNLETKVQIEQIKAMAKEAVVMVVAYAPFEILKGIVGWTGKAIKRMVGG